MDRGNPRSVKYNEDRLVLRPRPRGLMVDWRVLAAQRRADESYGTKGLTLGQISMEVGVSSHYLGKLFRREIGVTFHQYLRQVRMAMACSYLMDDVPRTI